ncbi:CBS domain-containing protein [Ekhidna sp.]|uniref:CBS domain-containing protein n=1 Tax=Ekhidna sp. TaxID=2608089 RepID=UPI003296EA7E
MGDLLVKSASEDLMKTQFIRHLLNDVKCLELMLERNLIESGISRIGAEQEFCLISKNWRPEKNADEILKAINDPHFTNELARFNLEINLDPVELGPDSLDQMERQLRALLKKAEIHASERDTQILLTGILPTISKTELSLEYMTPKPRYWSLNEMVKGIRGADFQLHIKGVDELFITHDSVLMEACNTSFQLHLQVDPNDFVSSYNWAQAISGPVLGICANSPLLLGRELWSETRIALFQQSIDTRHSTYALKDQISRVSFGEDWEYGTAADIYKNDIAQHKIILSKSIKRDSLEDLENGKIPKLEALNTHNGTIYRWNRACYGATDTAAHLRIENRYIPSGPTILDQMANFAFWIGLMKGRSPLYSDITNHMDFQDVKANFIKAARTGKQSVLKWKDRFVSVKDLITRELLPLAYEGLAKSNVDSETATRLLEVIDQRSIKQTGAQWSISNYRRLKRITRKDDALLALTKNMYENQQKDLPIHEWPDVPDVSNTHEHAYQVGHIMSTKLFTVKTDDIAALATQLMQWKNIHHIPVECDNGKICGILTWTHMQRFQEKTPYDDSLTVGDIMKEDVILAHSEMQIPEAIKIMKQNEIGCLPVVHNQHLIGIVTIKDIKPYDKSEGAQ